MHTRIASFCLCRVLLARIDEGSAVRKVTAASQGRVSLARGTVEQKSRGMACAGCLDSTRLAIASPSSFRLAPLYFLLSLRSRVKRGSRLDSRRVSLAEHAELPAKRHPIDSLQASSPHAVGARHTTTRYVEATRHLLAYAHCADDKLALVETFWPARQKQRMLMTGKELLWD